MRTTDWQSEEFDLAIVGGGINGAAIARDAALRGLRVILFEKKDFGSGASSASSKLAHGGLRYLESFEFRLVRKTLKERNQLIKNAPNLAKLIPFILPVYAGSSRPIWWLRTGLWIYDLLSGRESPRHTFLSEQLVLAKFPGLSSENLTGGLQYWDGLMDDSRITLTNALEAETDGAVVLNYTPVIGLDRKEGRVCGVVYEYGGEAHRIKARAVVNATGAWSNNLQDMAHIKRRFRVCPSKGIHIVLPEISSDTALILTTPQDKRVFFVIPWKGYSLVGTTDTLYEGDLDHVSVEDGEINYLLEAMNYYFPHTRYGKDSVISSFAGLRPLIQHKETIPTKASRDYIIHVGEEGLVNLIGGKYTAYRKMAEQTVDAALQFLQEEKSPCKTAIYPLTYPLNIEQTILPPEQWTRIENIYANKAISILGIINRNPEEARQICPLHPHLYAELTYAIEEEKARTLEDWFYRRTSIAYTECGGKNCYQQTKDHFFKISKNLK